LAVSLAILPPSSANKNVQRAIDFLSNPQTALVKVEEKRAFLIKQGVSQKEIDEATTLVEKSKTPAACTFVYNVLLFLPIDDIVIFIALHIRGILVENHENRRETAMSMFEASSKVPVIAFFGGKVGLKRRIRRRL
jgi:hypothetical protein